MSGEVDEILGDILRGVVPNKHLLSDVSQHVLEVCPEFGHVHSTQSRVKGDIC